MLHHSEWLLKAKAVPVGQKRRVHHGCGATASMDVWNNPESWSAYCHRCHDSGRVYKEYLTPVPKDVVVYRKYCNSADLVELSVLRSKHPEWFRRMIVLLQAKGVSTALLESVGARLRYNVKDHRLVLSFSGVDIGRDCTGAAPAKWLKYHRDDGIGYVYLQGKNTQDTRVAITEDLFSAAKITYYTGVSSMCLLGTALDDHKVTKLLQAIVLVCTDGDKAGYDAARATKQRLEVLGVPVQVRIKDGYDPKDMTPEELSELVLWNVN